MAQWLEYCLETSAREVEALAEALTAAGVPGLAVEDEADFLRFLEENRQYWDYVDEALAQAMKGAARVKFYLPAGEEAQGRRWLDGLGQFTFTCSVSTLEEDDWANSWKRYYHPLAIGERLYVVPQWLDHAAPQGRVSLILNPGLTFGTGSHPTTQLCLEGVERYTKAGDAVLDLGCGSGILSIAAVLLGAGRALGVDIDPKAPDVAYENAALNGVGRDCYQVLAGDVLGDRDLRARLGARRWDLILANIVADVIIPLSAFAGELLAPGGKFLCSGIIDTRAGEVRAALEHHGFRVLRALERKGWYAFECEAAR